MRPAPLRPPSGAVRNLKGPFRCCVRVWRTAWGPPTAPPSVPLTSPLVPLAHISVSSYPIGRVPSVLPPTPTDWPPNFPTPTHPSPDWPLMAPTPGKSPPAKLAKRMYYPPTSPHQPHRGRVHWPTPYPTTYPTFPLATKGPPGAGSRIFVVEKRPRKRQSRPWRPGGAAFLFVV
jgi:hypothetical protein